MHMKLIRTTKVALLGVAVSTIVLAVAIVLVFVKQSNTNQALCVAAGRSAETKALFVDVFDRAFDGEESDAFIAELRAAVDAEMDGLAGYCSRHD